MSLFRTEKPSRDKEKAIRAVQEADVEIARIGFLIPMELKIELQKNAIEKKISCTDIIISLIEQYLRAEEESNYDNKRK